jgi:hypothetical protein
MEKELKNLGKNETWKKQGRIGGEDEELEEEEITKGRRN